VNAVATEGMLGDLNPLGDGDAVFNVFFYFNGSILIVGGL